MFLSILKKAVTTPHITCHLFFLAQSILVLLVIWLRITKPRDSAVPPLERGHATTFCHVTQTIVAVFPL